MSVKAIWRAVLIVCAWLCVCAGGAHAQDQLRCLPDGQGNACIISVPESWTRVEIPAEVDGYRVTALADGLLAGRENVVSVSVGESVERIGADCFAGCSRLREVTLNEGLKEIGEGAFSNCVSLERIELPRRLRLIGDGAFENTALEEIVLSEGLTELGGGVFAGCEELVRISAGRRLRTIDENAFARCGAELRVEYGSAAEQFAQEHGIKYEYMHQEERGWVYQCDARGAVLCFSLRAREEDEVPFSLGGARVYALGAGAFQADEALQHISLPQGIVSIDDWAFSYCPRLEEIDLGEGLERIGADAFRECGSLRRAVLPASLQEIGERAFEGCEALTLIVVKGSEGERWAKENGMAYEIASESLSEIDSGTENLGARPNP